MSSSILHPPSNLPPSVALQLSQQAPALLSKTPSSIAPYSLSSVYAAPETPELWTTYENLMLSCLRTGDQQSARVCLDRLLTRFGGSNERLMALQGLYQEATAENDTELQRILKEYDAILKEDPGNTPVSKRRIALLRSLGKHTDAIAALALFLDCTPTDAEAWAELSDLYASQGLYQQSIFALEEVLLITPNAWNIHAKLGELLFTSAGLDGNTGKDNTTEKNLQESVRRFSRSIELCDDYLRGFYGLKLATSRALQNMIEGSNNKSKVDPTSLKTLQSLNQLATAKLTEIVRRSVAREAGWEGYDAAELIAARELLDRDAVKTVHHDGDDGRQLPQLQLSWRYSVMAICQEADLFTIIDRASPHILEAAQRPQGDKNRTTIWVTHYSDLFILGAFGNHRPLDTSSLWSSTSYLYISTLRTITPRKVQIS
ncbi:hypothetical protein V495_00004 [Pseudogymnoascus sp. VKM F-4514 (FW-929)]|nr:hypothetical protein V495_00004 [Pseudogymnoascus sp. VKM F-4514 (FW-929)]KFY55020.1 hypothetical protein V497_07259 [Pseudogymnoascus sp. VKM F-4516 (FW-969)]